MKRFLVALGLVTVVVSHAAAEGTQDGLSLTIVPGKDKSGAFSIDRNGRFAVVFTNRSTKPIRLWSESCRLGYETLSFQVDDGSGPPWVMAKVARYSSDWKNKRLQKSTIPPGGIFRWEVAPSSIWGEREWKGVPEANTGKPIRLRAVFEIKPSDAAREHGVWAGRLTSEPVETLVVDPKLRTPHEYLEAECPKQAVRMMQADPAWLSRKDSYQQTPLHIAARYGSSEAVRWLLSQKATDVNARAYNQFTPLHLAEDPEIVRLLLEHKADVNAKSVSGTPLQQAADNWARLGQDPECAADRARWRTITKVLLDAGAEYDIRSASYLNDVERVRVLVADKRQARDKEALRWAATYGHVEVVKLLLEHGADPEDAGYGGLTVSYFAVEHADVLRALFDAGANPKVVVTYRGNGPGPEGSTLLHEAAERGALESVRRLLAKGLDVNGATPRGDTPLHGACLAGHLAMVELLLKNKADPKARDDCGWTPMGMATRQVRPDNDDDNARYQVVIRALERAGVDVDVLAAIACDDVRRVGSILTADPKAARARDGSGKPALHRAVELDRREIVKLLLDKGCDPDIRSEDETSGCKNETALLEAAFWGRPEIAALLLERGAKVNAKAERGVVPLHEAARMGQVEVARLLLKHGADVNARDDDGKTPLDWVESFREVPEMTRLLKDHGGQKKADAGKRQP